MEGTCLREGLAYMRYTVRGDTDFQRYVLNYWTDTPVRGGFPV